MASHSRSDWKNSVACCSMYCTTSVLLSDKSLLPRMTLFEATPAMLHARLAPIVARRAGWPADGQQAGLACLTGREAAAGTSRGEEGGQMTDWTPTAVRAAAAEWVWVPPDAREIVTGEYQLVGYPDYFQQPTQVAWTLSARPAGQLIDEVLAHVASWNRTAVWWWIREDTQPDDLEAELKARGGMLDDAVQVLAYELGNGLPDLGLSDPGAPFATGADDGELQVEVVRDERTLRAFHLVNAEVWDEHRERTPAAIAEELAEVRQSDTDIRVVVFADSEPAAAGGCGLVGQVARLWGAGTRAAFRGRGAYRLVLAERLRLAAERGATLALVKGKVDTSGPILRRAGFAGYGEERAYRLELPEG